MQVGEQDLVLAQPRVLLGDRLLDLEDEIAGRPHLVGRVEDGGAGCDVVVVRYRRPDTCRLLDEDLVARSDELVNPGRGDGDAVLMDLQLAWNPDLHDHQRPSRSRAGVWRRRV